MKKLPHMKYSDQIVRQQQVKFGGYAHTPYAKDGEIYDMKNITVDNFPLIGPREGRKICNIERILLYKGYEYNFYLAQLLILKLDEIHQGLSGKELVGGIIKIECDEFSENNGYYKISRTESDGITIDDSKQFKTHSGGGTREPNRYDKELRVYLECRGSNAEETVVTSIEEEYKSETESSDVTTYTIDENKNIVTKRVTKTTQTTETENVYLVTTETTITTQPIDSEIMAKNIGMGDKFCFIDDKNAFYYDGIYCGDVKGQVTQIVYTGNYIFLLPREIENGAAICNTNTREFKRCMTRRVNQYYVDTEGSFNVEFDSDEIVVNYWTQNFDTYFNIGDVVTVNIYDNDRGVIFSNKGTIKSVSSQRIIFTEDILSGFFDLDLSLKEMKNIVKVTISNSIPRLQHICAGNNRIWGCDEKTIYCTAFSKPLAWYEYSAIDDGYGTEGAWTIRPFDNVGDFTGCTFFDGAPIFFKEKKIYKVYGDNPANFTLVEYDMPGVAKGAEKTIQAIQGILYYLSTNGVMRFSQGLADNISTEFYEEIEEGTAGETEHKYYLSGKTKDGWKMFVYDTQKRLWSVEDNTEVRDFVYFNRNLYMLDSNNTLQCIGDGEHKDPIYYKCDEEEQESFIEFADSYCDSPDKKAVSKLYFRFTIEDGGEVKIELNYDSEEEEGERIYKTVKELKADTKKTYTLPIIPNRCDHFRIRISGKRFMLYSMAYEYYDGTSL